MPRRVKRIIEPEDFSALREMQGTLRDVPPRFWAYFASGLLGYLKQNSPRGLELIQNLRAIAWMGAEIAKTRGVDVAGEFLAHLMTDYKLPRRRSSSCCPPFVLLCQREAVRLGFTQQWSRPRRNRALALQSFRAAIQEMLTVVHGLAGSPHLHRATSVVPKNETLDNWFGEYSGKKQNMTWLITELLTYYHASSHHVMRRRVSSSVALLDRVLRPIQGKPHPTSNITLKEMLPFAQQLSS